MSMNLYNAADIRSKVSIVRYFQDQGIPLKSGNSRAVATWRDGKNPSVSIDADKNVFFDHVAGSGGSVIDAYMLIEGGTPLEAVRVLGDRYAAVFGFAPATVARKPKKMTRGEMLVKDGYALTVTYTYTDEQGDPAYFVDRYERTDADGNREKSFVQRSLTAENLDGVKRVPYNLPAVVKAQTVFIAEGEKDVETLRRLGLVGTTNSGGASTWDADFNRYFDNKDVVILPDNDDAGKKHSDLVAAQLKHIAKSIKIVRVSKLPKGDITDYIEREGGDLASLMEMVNAAPTADIKDDAEVLAAKAANAAPFTNWDLGEISVKQNKDGTSKTKQTYRARRIDDLCDEIHTRFLNFPRKIGSSLFDYTRHPDPAKRRIMTILTKNDLHAWVDGVSGHQSNFMSGSEYASWDTIFARLMQTATTYDGIAAAPWYPTRSDTFPIYEMLPQADPTHSRFNEFVAFFNPATNADRVLIRAFFIAPIWFTGHDDRPAWCVDTVDAQQSGKTSVVKACAALYNEKCLDMDLKSVNGDINQLKKRVLSAEGRSKRIALFDNLEQTLKSGNLAQLVTADSVSGMAAYGHGEETRLNDITWCATVNGVGLDTDMATRTYTVHIKRPERYDPHWKRKLYAFIGHYRAQIHADMIDMIQNAPERIREGSRFPAFDAAVLSAASASDAEFDAACAKIAEVANAANEDSDRAEELVELIHNKIGAHKDDQSGIRTDCALVIPTTTMDEILRSSTGAIRQWTAKRVRKLIKMKCTDRFAEGYERITGGEMRKVYGNPRAFCYFPRDFAKRSGTVSAQLVTMQGGMLKALVTETIKL